jgi:hypothetical protein
MGFVQGAYPPGNDPASRHFRDQESRGRSQVFRITRKDDILPRPGIVEGLLRGGNGRNDNKHKKNRLERSIVLVLRHDDLHGRACDNECLRR